MKLVLSLFTGAGLLDRGFREAGFCVVSAGDILWGHDVRDFQPASHTFEGVIGGPCDRRLPKTNAAAALRGRRDYAMT